MAVSQVSTTKPKIVYLSKFNKSANLLKLPTAASAKTSQNDFFAVKELLERTN